MKLFLVTDNIDTAAGMRLAGIESEIVSSPEMWEDAVERAADREGLAVLIVSHSVAQGCSGCIENIRRRRSLPLIVDLPGEDEA